MGKGGPGAALAHSARSAVPSTGAAAGTAQRAQQSNRDAKAAFAHPTNITFVPRADSLDPVSVVGTGLVARALAQRLLRLSDDGLAALRGIAGDDLIALLGDTAALPWVDGVTYLGRDAGAPRLLLPTTLRPAVGVDVFERAIIRHAGAHAGPWAVLAAPPRVIPLGDALPVERACVLRFLGAPP